MMQNSIEFNNIQIKPFTPEERDACFKAMALFLENKKKPPIRQTLPPEVQKIFEKVKVLLEQSSDSQNISPAQGNQEHEYLAMDGLFMILKSVNYHAPHDIYYRLMKLCKRQQHHLYSRKIAEYLYYKQYVNYHVLNILMKSANTQHKPWETLTLFEDSHQLVNDKKQQDLLHIEYIKALIATGATQKALTVCLSKLESLYSFSYSSDWMRFLKVGTQYDERDVTVADSFWTEEGVISFCLTLADIYEKDKNWPLDHALAIASFLYQVNPHDPRVVISLSHLYKKIKEKTKAQSLFISYLEKHPNDVRVATHYVIFLIEMGDVSDAYAFCNNFILEYEKNSASAPDLRKIKILHAWFNDNYDEGKHTFIQLLQTFPHHIMLFYLAIRYAMKIGDEPWKEDLLKEAPKHFSNQKDLEFILRLSKVSAICAAIEDHYFTTTPLDLLSDKPKDIVLSRACRLPDVILNAFQQLCVCNTNPCSSKCLDNAFLVGSSVELCLDSSEADKKNQVFDFDKKLSDLDFVVLVPKNVIDTINIPGFERSQFVENLLTYKSPESKKKPDIDVMLYPMGPRTENDTADIISYIAKKRDYTVSMFVSDKDGFVFDPTQGQAFHAYDNRYLKTYDNPLECLQEDQVRLLRIFKKLQQGYSLHPSLEKALYTFEPSSWFTSGERIRKKFVGKILAESREAFIDFLKKYNLFGPGIDSSVTETELLERCLILTAQHSGSNEKDRIYNWLFTDIKRHEEIIDLDDIAQNLKKDISNTRTEVRKLEANLKSLIKSEKNKNKKNKKKSTQVDILESNQLKIPDVKKEQHRPNLDTDISKEEQIAELIALYNTAFSKYHPHGLFKANQTSPIFMNKPWVLDKAEWNVKKWNVNAMRNMAKCNSCDLFSAFILFYLGCFYLAENTPLSAWYYLRLAKKRFSNQKSTDVLFDIFLQEIFEPLLADAYTRSGIDNMTGEQPLRQVYPDTGSIQKKQKFPPEFDFSAFTDESGELAHYWDSKAAYIEKVFVEKNEFEKDAIRTALLDLLHIRSDFTYFIALYNKALESNILNELENDEVSSFLFYFMKLSVIKKPELRLDFYSKQKIMKEYPMVHARMLDYSSKIGLQAPEQEDKMLVYHSIYGMIKSKSIKEKCSYHIELAENYLNTLSHDEGGPRMCVMKAKAHYEHALKDMLLNEKTSSYQKEYGFLYAFVQSRLSTLQKQNFRSEGYSSFSTLVPLFSKLIDELNPLGDKKQDSMEMSI